MMENSLKILMICPNFHPIIGGYERAARRLSAALVKRGHHVTVISERKDVSWERSEVIEGIQVRRLWCRFRKGPGTVSRLLRVYTISTMASYAMFLAFNGHKYSIWHVHAYGLHAALAVVFGKLIRRPVIVKLTSSVGGGIVSKLSKSRWSHAMVFLHRKVSAVAAPSSETADEARSLGIPANRIHLIPNGIETETAHSMTVYEREELKKSIGLGKGKNVVLSVGTLRSEKNFEGLLDAWKLASKRLPAEWILVIVGGGPLRSILEDRVQLLGLEGRVFLAGRQEQVEMWYACADLFVLSSNLEGMSNALLEAMAHGLPVVATRVSGTKDLVEESGAGSIVEVGDMRTLSNRIVQLAEDSSLRVRMGNAARMWILQGYSINRIAEKYESVYRELALVR